MDQSICAGNFEALLLQIRQSIAPDGVWQPRKWKKYPHLRKALAETHLPGFETIDEKIYAAKTGVLHRPVCAVCGGTVKLKNLVDGFRRTCSVKCAANDSQTKNKTSSTLRERYGSHHTQNKQWTSAEVKKRKENGSFEKAIKTLKSNIGATSVFALDTVKTKIEATNKERYGVKNPQQDPGVREKTRQTLQDRYGKNHSLPLLLGEKNPMKNRECVLSSRFTKLSKKPWHEIEKHSELLFVGVGKPHLFKCRVCENEFESERLSARCRCTEKSIETQIATFIKDLGFAVKRNDRRILNGMEIDILCAERNFAVEVDGLFWHGERNLSKRVKNVKTYHSEKTRMAAEKGIALIHISDEEWSYQADIVKSMIKHRLGITERSFFARSCEIKEIDAPTCRQFLERTHIQGFVGGKLRLGLFHKGTLVGAAVFGQSRFAPGIELIRLAFELNTQVIGGAGKLIKAGMKCLKADSLTSYADMRYGTGGVYEKLGFELKGTSDPGYWYISPTYRTHSRQAFQKHKLKRFETFDESLSEWENMKLAGYDRIWDCGHKKFVLSNVI